MKNAKKGGKPESIKKIVLFLLLMIGYCIWSEYVCRLATGEPLSRKNVEYNVREFRTFDCNIFALWSSLRNQFWTLNLLRQRKMCSKSCKTGKSQSLEWVLWNINVEYSMNYFRLWVNWFALGPNFAGFQNKYSMDVE